MSLNKLFKTNKKKLELVEALVQVKAKLHQGVTKVRNLDLEYQ